jgi:hypothetical protein
MWMLCSVVLALMQYVLLASAEEYCEKYGSTNVSGTLLSGPVKIPKDSMCCDLCIEADNCTAAQIDVILVDGSVNCTLYTNHTLISNASSSSHSAFVRATRTVAPSSSTPAPPPAADSSFYLVLYCVLGGGVLILIVAVLHVYRERVFYCCDRTPPGWRYTIVSELGQGAFSSVFLVRRATDGTKMALKLIPCRTKAELHEALNEYRTTLRLQGHDNLVRVHDMFTNWHDTVSFSEKKSAPLAKPLLGGGKDNHDADKKGGKGGEPKYLCIVMSYYPEGTLLDLLSRITVPLPELTIVRFSFNVASALAHMHQHNVMHRDLKPANILMDKDYTVTVVTDFGLCRNYNGEYCHTRAGTLHYMAPEQADRKYTSMADMWALGCLIYGMGTRRVRQPRVRVMFMARRSPSFEEELREEMKSFGYSDKLCDFMFRLLSVKPVDRPTALLAQEELREMAKGNQEP